jgi:heptosyltransferase III
MIQPKKLLIVRTDRIGDVVLSLPLAEIVKKKYPECRITFLLRNYTSELAADHPFIDEIKILEEKDKKISLIKNIKMLKGRFDTAIIVYPTFITSLIIFLSGIKNRIGTGYRWYSFLFNQKVFEHRKYAEKHELEYNIGLLKVMGIDKSVSYNNVHFNLKVNEKSLIKVKDYLKGENYNSAKPVIIIHPGSGGSAVDLPVKNIKELIELIFENLDTNIIITGSKSEKELCSSLAIDPKIINAAGQFNLSELTALISLSDIFIANSTGPIHIAAALNKYIIGFYPKILSCSPQRWGPYSNKTSIFLPEIDCEKCSREQCERLNCMSSIQVSKVFVQINNYYKVVMNIGEKND